MPYTFFTKPEYYQTLLERLEATGAGDRIALTTMDFEPTVGGVTPIVQALCAAAGRGADVTLAVDAYPLLSPVGFKPGPLFFGTGLPETAPGNAGEVLKALDTLRAAGCRAGLINLPHRRFTNPFGGRSHIKFSVINDRVFLGGCNLSTPRQIDVMAGWDDAATAGFLRNLAREFLASGSAYRALGGRDVTRRIAPDTTLLIDAGQPGRSVILDHALALVDAESRHVTLTCQYFPTRRITRHLAAKAHRGLDVEIYFNDPSRRSRLQNAVHSSLLARERLRLPKHFFAHPLRDPNHYLHAKILAGTTSAMVGSHNYVDLGVRFGTAEAALLIGNRQTAEDLIATVIRQLTV